VFKQKSGYNDHMNKKVDCIQNTVLDAVIEKKVKQAINASQHKQEVTKETFPAFFEDLHNLLWNKAGLSPERALEHMTFFFAYRLIEQQADALSLPQECRWSYIANIKNAGELFAEIENGTAKFWENPVTQIFFKPHEIKKVDLVYDIVQEINRISLKTLQETDSLGDMFEYMLGRGMSTMSDEGQYFTNRTICKLAFKLAYDIKKNLRRADGTLCTFADWFCGTGGFPAEFIKGVNQNLPSVDWEKEFTSIYCQDMNLSSVTSTLLNMLILTGVPFSGEKIRGSNSFSEPITTGAGAPFNGVTIDYCFMNPPYGGDKTKGKEYKFAYSKKVKGEDGSTTKKFFVNQEIQSIGIEDDDKVSAGVQLAMATLSADGGVCSIVLPQGFFFGASKKCVELRKKIAEEYKIWYVVDIASGAFKNTGTKTSMMVFQKGVGATDKVSFIGLDEKLLVEATLSELRAKNYSLNYKQYLPQSAVEVEGVEMVKLGDLATITTGKNKTPDDKKGSLYPYYGTSGVTGYTDHFLEDGEYILTARNGTIGNTFLIKGKSYPSDHMFTLRVNEKCLLKYLYYWMMSNKKVMENLANVTTIPGITRSYLIDIQIPIPSLERQEQIVEAIDGWAGLAHQEEVALKILEKQVMFQVKEMGRGQARVKLGEVIKKVKSGKTNSTEASGSGEYDFYGCTAKVPTNTHNTYDFDGEEYLLFAKSGGNAKTKVGENLGIGKFHYVTGKTAGNIAVFQYNVDSTKATCPFMYYLLKTKLEEIQLLADYTTGNGNINIELMYQNVDLQLPPLTEQQTLQSDFDEIRHKHAKIAVYKAKTQEAIQRLIPTA
jgi:type I restriction-modification system DNA methylase subunit/restriction endonuclease S subunit